MKIKSEVETFAVEDQYEEQPLLIVENYHLNRKFIVMKFLDKQFLVSPEEVIAAIQNASNDGVVL
jgi:hypothetical protein